MCSKPQHILLLAEPTLASSPCCREHSHGRRFHLSPLPSSAAAWPCASPNGISSLAARDNTPGPIQAASLSHSATPPIETPSRMLRLFRRSRGYLRQPPHSHGRNKQPNNRTTISPTPVPLVTAIPGHAHTSCREPSMATTPTRVPNPHWSSQRETLLPPLWL